MTKHRAKRSLAFKAAMALFAIGLVFLGVGAWQYFLADNIDGAAKQNVAVQYSPKRFVDPAQATHLGDVFARIVVPRLGSDYVRLVGEGTKWHPVLNEIGVGHYNNTAMPGEVGNFATAAHRGGFGGSYKNIHRLVKGDKVYVETNQGWYTYGYRQTKIVKPTDTNVISAVPKELVGSHEGGSYMTMTSCDPIFVNTNRIIVWLELEGFTPLDRGAPAEISWVDAK
jgi:sortase A